MRFARSASTTRSITGPRTWSPRSSGSRTGAASTSCSTRSAAAVLPTAIGWWRRSGGGAWSGWGGGPLGGVVVFGVSRMAAGERRSLWRAATTLVTMPRFNPLSLMNRNRGVFGLNGGHLWSERERLVEGMLLLLDEIGAGRIRPIVARTFRLEQAADAHRFVHSRSNT